MYENASDTIDRALRNDEGMSSELDYAEQTSRVLFLKYLNDLEAEHADRAALEGRDHAPTPEEGYRWSDWAAPKDADGAFDHDAAMTGEDLIAFAIRPSHGRSKRWGDSVSCTRSPGASASGCSPTRAISTC